MWYDDDTDYRAMMQGASGAGAAWGALGTALNAVGKTHSAWGENDDNEALVKADLDGVTSLKNIKMHDSGRKKDFDAVIQSNKDKHDAKMYVGVANGSILEKAFNPTITKEDISETGNDVYAKDIITTTTPATHKVFNPQTQQNINSLFKTRENEALVKAQGIQDIKALELISSGDMKAKDVYNVFLDDNGKSTLSKEGLNMLWTTIQNERKYGFEKDKYEANNTTSITNNQNSNTTSTDNNIRSNKTSENNNIRTNSTKVVKVTPIQKTINKKIADITDPTNSQKAVIIANDKTKTDDVKIKEINKLADKKDDSLNSKMKTEFDSMVQGLQDFNNWKDQHKDSYTGLAQGGIIPTVTNLFGFNVGGEDEAIFRQTRELMIGPITKAIYGGHASDADRKNIEKSFPSFGDTDTEFKAKMKSLNNRGLKTLKTKIDIGEQQGLNVDVYKKYLTLFDKSEPTKTENKSEVVGTSIFNKPPQDKIVYIKKDGITRRWNKTKKEFTDGQ